MNSVLCESTFSTAGLGCATYFIVVSGSVLRTIFRERKASEKCLGSSFPTWGRL